MQFGMREIPGRHDNIDIDDNDNDDGARGIR